MCFAKVVSATQLLAAAHIPLVLVAFGILFGGEGLPQASFQVMPAFSQRAALVAFAPLHGALSTLGPTNASEVNYRLPVSCTMQAWTIT